MGKGLAPAGTAAEKDAQQLLKLLMPAAQAGLEEQESFCPMAALIAQDGTVHQFEAAPANARPTHASLSAPDIGEGARPGTQQWTKQQVALLREKLRRRVQAEGARAAALAADVMIWRGKDGEEASTAVSVHVEHQGGYCADLLIPYKVRKGMMSRLRKKRQIMFRKMIAQESDTVIFAAKGVQRPNHADQA